MVAYRLYCLDSAGQISLADWINAAASNSPGLQVYACHSGTLQGLESSARSNGGPVAPLAAAELGDRLLQIGAAKIRP